MREPKLGEMLRCAICGGEVNPIDEKWLEYFRKQSHKHKRNIYDGEHDFFLSYDGCEESSQERR